jgi:hypothetical protein
LVWSQEQLSRYAVTVFCDGWDVEKMTASTVQQAPDPTEVRTYGNWRKPSSPGLPGVGLLGTVLLLSGIVLVVLVQLVAGFIPAGIVLLLVIVAVAPMLIKNREGVRLSV